MGLIVKAKDSLFNPIARTTAHYLREMARADLEKSNDLTNGGVVLGPPIRRSAAATNMYDPGLRRKPDSSVSFEVLRRFARTHEVSRICINARKRQMSSLDWAIVPVDPEDKTDYTADIDLIRAYFKNLGGYRVRFREFQDTLIEDLLVLDAACAYKQRDRAGNILYYMPVDSSTIKLRVDEQGNTPEPPEPAYIQYVNGNKTGEFTADEMIYEMMNPRTETPYGLAPLESLILIVTSALKGTLYNLAFLTEGNVPEGIMSMPEGWSTKQISEYADYWDALISGDQGQQRKVKFAPGGSTYTATNKITDMAFKEFNEWLLMITCAMFDIQPQEIGFTMQVNKANGAEQNDIATRRGLLPLANLLTEIYDDIIQVDLGFPHLKFKFYGLEDRDQLLEAQVQQIHVQSGIRTIDEIRKDDLSLDPLGISQPYVLGVTQFLTPTMLANDMETPPQDDNAAITSTEAHDDTTSESGDSKLIPAIDPSSSADPEKSLTADDELLRLQKYAIRRIKLGKAYRPFESEVLAADVVDDLNTKLAKATDATTVKSLISSYYGRGNPRFLAKSGQTSSDQNSTQQDDYEHNPHFDQLLASAAFAKFAQDFQEAIMSQAEWTADNLKTIESILLIVDMQDVSSAQRGQIINYLSEKMPPIADKVSSQQVVDWYKEVTNTSVNSLYETLGSDVKFNLTNEAVINNLEARAETLLTKSTLDDTTKKQLATLIVKSKDAGMTTAEIKKAITENFTDISKVRAGMIAHTETVNLMNKQQYDAMHRVGVMQKAWLNFGPNPCMICLTNAGDGFIPMSSMFSSGDLMPSAHVGCECGLDYSMVDIALGDLWDGE